MDRDNLYGMGLELWNLWTRMWHGEPELARAIVAERFALHLTVPGGIDEETVTGPEGVERWVRTHRAKFQRLVFHTVAGPFVDVAAGVVAGPWHADTSLDGSPRPMCGMDTIAFRDGRITEYWTIANEVQSFGRWSVFVTNPRPLR